MRTFDTNGCPAAPARRAAEICSAQSRVRRVVRAVEPTCRRYRVDCAAQHAPLRKRAAQTTTWTTQPGHVPARRRARACGAAGTARCTAQHARVQRNATGARECAPRFDLAKFAEEIQRAGGRKVHRLRRLADVVPSSSTVAPHSRQPQWPPRGPARPLARPQRRHGCDWPIAALTRCASTQRQTSTPAPPSEYRRARRRRAGCEGRGRRRQSFRAFAKRRSAK